MREMKESGLGYLGTIPAHWKLERIKNHLCFSPERNPGNATVLSLYREHGVVPKDSRDDNHNVTSEDTSNYRYVEIGDFVVNKMKAWQGSMAVSDYNGIVSPAYYVYHFKTDEVDRKYLHYLLRSKCYADEFRRMSGGIRVGQWDLSRNDFESTYISVPQKDEQLKIAFFLDTQISKVDRLINSVQSQIEKIKSHKQGIISQLVTMGCHPSVSTADSGISWIGKIPSHWKVIRLKHLYDFSNGSPVRVGPFGSAMSGSDITSEGVWVYNQRTVIDQNFETNDTFVSEEKAAELSGFAVYPKDILITTRGSIGKTAIVPDNAPIGILHPCVIRFRIDEGIMDNNLLSLIFNETNICLGQIMDMSNSTTIEVLYSYSLKEIWIPCPPLHEQKEILLAIQEKIKKYNRLIEIKQEKIEKLEQYKKSLIYEYVTGKKEVM